MIEYFSPEDLRFDYSKLHPKYYASKNPNDEIILYKGALRGYENKGFLSRALVKGKAEHVIEVKKLIESGDDKTIRKLFERHTSCYSYTALLSATFNPEQHRYLHLHIPWQGKKKIKQFTSSELKQPAVLWIVMILAIVA